MGLRINDTLKNILQEEGFYCVFRKTFGKGSNSKRYSAGIMDFNRIPTLADILSINPNISNDGARLIKYEFIRHHPDIEFWDFAQHYGFRGRSDLEEHTSKWEGERRLVKVSTKGNLTWLGPNSLNYHHGVKNGYERVKLFDSDYSVHRIVSSTFIPTNGRDPSLLVPNHLDGVKYNNSVNNLEWSTIAENLDHALVTGLKNRSIYLLRVVAPNVYKGREFVVSDLLEYAKLLGVSHNGIFATSRGVYGHTSGFECKEIPKEESSKYFCGIPNDIKELFLFNKSYFNPKTKAYLGVNSIGDSITAVGGKEAKKLGFDISKIVKCCRGHAPTHRGYSWKYMTIREASESLVNNGIWPKVKEVSYVATDAKEVQEALNGI